jgi:hypothetical protein
MTRLDVNVARCEALFASGLQRSDALTAVAVAEPIRRAVGQFGIGGCVSLVAQEFGDHSETARDHMQWIRQLVGEAKSPSPVPPRMRPSRPSAVPGVPPDQMSPAAPSVGAGRVPVVLDINSPPRKYAPPVGDIPGRRAGPQRWLHARRSRDPPGSGRRRHRWAALLTLSRPRPVLNQSTTPSPKGNQRHAPTSHRPQGPSRRPSSPSPPSTSSAAQKST